MKLSGMAATVLLMIGAAGLASATVVPEVDPGTGMNALALLAGVALVIRSGLKK